MNIASINSAINMHTQLQFQLSGEPRKIAELDEQRVRNFAVTQIQIAQAPNLQSSNFRHTLTERPGC